nr:hypothetical protein [Tanacetum cinerariifolium]
MRVKLQILVSRIIKYQKVRMEAYFNKTDRLSTIIVLMISILFVDHTNAFEEHSFERFSAFKNSFSLLHVPMVTPIDDTRIFGNAYDDVLDEEVDMNNVDSSYVIPEATKFLKDHPSRTSDWNFRDTCTDKTYVQDI